MNRHEEKGRMRQTDRDRRREKQRRRQTDRRTEKRRRRREIRIYANTEDDGLVESLE